MKEKDSKEIKQIERKSPQYSKRRRHKKGKTVIILLDWRTPGNGFFNHPAGYYGAR